MFRLNKRMWLLLLIALIALTVAPIALAQETTAGLQGTVRDSSGGSIAGATLEVSGPALIGVRKVASDETLLLVAQSASAS